MQAGAQPGVRAGAAQLVVTPPLDVQRGRPGRRLDEPTEGVHDDLVARALVVESLGVTVAVITCDAIGIPGMAFTQRVRALVAEACGIPGEHLLVAATHAHSTPWTLNLHDADIDDAWLETWAHQLASVAELAARRLVAASMHHASRELQLAENRRVVCADGRVYKNWVRPKPAAVVRQHPIDPELGLLWFEHLDGRPLALLANYAMHPVTVMSMPFYSADYPGVACRLLEGVYGAGFVALFANGATADVNPPNVRKRWDDAWQTGLVVGGAMLQGSAATQLLLHRQGEQTAASAAMPIAARTRRITPPYRPVPPSETGRQAILSAQLAAVVADGEPLEIQVLRLGDLALVGVPGELFCEIGLAIKQQSPAPRTLVIGFANSYQGYFPTPVAYEEGDYEVMPAPWSRYTAEAGQQIEATALALLRECFPD